jgi:hypothetical protein
MVLGLLGLEEGLGLKGRRNGYLKCEAVNVFGGILLKFPALLAVIVSKGAGLASSEAESAMSFTTFVRYTLQHALFGARRLLFPALLVCAAVPAQAESTDAGALEARVDRLLWQLVNDERYGHLQVAANYERLRSRLLEETCFVSAAPCAHDDRLMHHGLMMTTEITPEQEAIVEQLMFTLHNASAAIGRPSEGLMVSATE